MSGLEEITKPIDKYVQEQTQIIIDNYDRKLSQNITKLQKKHEEDIEKAVASIKEKTEQSLKTRLMAIFSIFALVLTAAFFVFTLNSINDFRKSEKEFDDSKKQVNEVIEKVNGSVISLQKDIISAQTIIRDSSKDLENKTKEVGKLWNELEALKIKYEISLKK